MDLRPEDFEFDLVEVLRSVVAITTNIPDDAVTANVLGTERSGNGVLIDDGIVLTIGYLITEAKNVWISLSNGTTVPGHVLGYDQETGFGLVQALGPIQEQPVELGDSDAMHVGSRVVMCGAGGVSRAVEANVVARQEFAGYWEYVLESAIFTAPAHPHWGGTAVLSGEGKLVGIGSLQVQHAEVDGQEDVDLNMVVPINLLKPILNDLLTIGQAKRPPRPWLGVYATEIEGNIVVAGIAESGPNENSGLQIGDIVLAVDDQDIDDLAGFFRKVWSLGEAGVDVPLQVHRSGQVIDITLHSADRRKLLKGPVVH